MGWSRGKKRWLVPALAVAVLADGATSAWALTRSPSESATGTSTLVAAAVSDLSQTVAASGTIEPKRRSDLAFSVSDTVTSVPATVGKKIKKGGAGHGRPATLQSAAGAAA